MSHAARQNLKSAIFCLSLANLFFLHSWNRLGGIYGDPFFGHAYFRVYPNIGAAAALLNTLVLAVLLYAAHGVIRRQAHPLFRWLGWCGVACLLLAVINTCRQLANWPPLAAGQLIRNPLFYLALAALAGAFWRWPAALGRGLKAGIFMFAPAVLLTFWQSLSHWEWREAHPSPALPRIGDAGPSNGAPRVVCIIMDELDERLVFRQRPATLHLPHLDAFRAQSFHASNAYPPGNCTALSLPCYLTGRIFKQSRPVAPNDLALLEYTNTAFQSWRSFTSLPHTAWQMRMRTAVVGFYHPYDRVLPAPPHRCTWESFILCDPYGRKSLFAVMTDEVRDIVDPWFHANRVRVTRSERHRHLLQAAREYVADPRLQWVFLHLPVPHVPGIEHYDFPGSTHIDGTAEDYFGNLLLADRTFGLLRDDMQTAGVWDATTVMVTSDHWWRESHRYDGQVDQRIPFMIKLAGLTQGRSYESPFNTALLHDLTLELLRGKLTTVDDLQRWIDANRSAHPVHAWQSPSNET